MSKPKKKASQPVPPPPPVTSDERVAVIVLKGTQEYRDWLERIFRKTHLPKATIFRLAVAEWAERHGHESPPEF